MTEDIIRASIGGIIIGASATMLLYFKGRAAGISGILRQAVLKDENDFNWSLIFIAGLLLGGLFFSLFYPQIMVRPDQQSSLLIPAGFLVGFGAILGSGCTSGHGICGISRFYYRSIVATCVFIATGVLTVFGLRIFGLFK